MADPANLHAIEEIRFATGKNIRPLVLPEIRVFDLLTRFYNIGRELRYINLAMIYQLKREEKKVKEPAIKAAPQGMTDEELREREKVRVDIDFSQSDDLLGEEDFQKMAEQQFEAQHGQGGEEQEPAAPVEPEPPPPAVPPPPAPAEEPKKEKPAPEPVARKPGVEPYHEVAQTLYSHLMKRGVSQYIPKATLQEFLKLFVKSQLKNCVLSTNFLANWMIIEADAPVEWLEEVLEEYKGIAEGMGVIAVLPGEPMPEIEAPPPEEVAPPPAQAPAEEAPPGAPQPVEEAGPEEPVPPPAEYGEAEVFELGDEDLVSVEEAEAAVIVDEAEEEEELEEYEKLTLDEARQKLVSEVNDRRDISRIVLGFAQDFFKRSLLFTVRGGKLYGWDGVGPGISANMVESIMLPLSDPGVFQLVNLTMSFFLGPIPPTPTNERYLKILGNEKPNNAFIMPVVVNEKVVYVLYGDNGEGEFVPVNAPELQILAYQIPTALQNLIMRKKAEKPAE
jgi:hypothetical protein